MAVVTLRYVVRYLVVLGILYSVVFALTPFLAPYWTLYVGCLATSLGGLIYVGNLPLRV